MRFEPTTTRLAAAAWLVAAVAACERPAPVGEWAASAPLVPAARGEALSTGDWPSYNRDLAGTRFSPLAEIDTGNVARLAEAWRYPLPRHRGPSGSTGGYELTPLVIDGVLYASAADRVVALAADTGRELWQHRVPGELPSHRGVTYWPGDAGQPPRLFFTAGRRLVALDAQSGELVRNFGAGGTVEMAVVYDSAPTRFEDLLIVGSNSAPGGVRAYDARTGTEVWVFDAVPGPGDPGREAWHSDAWREEPNLLHRAFSLTVDMDRALVYAVFEGPGPEAYYGGNRPGDTLFANSIVALDAWTGARRWHFQTVHHDIWDYGLPAPPSLLDVTIDGRAVPVLAQATKQGYLFILNRVTGEPVFGVEERPVPASSVPGERSSPTQPVPLKPRPLARMTYAVGDIVTAEDTTEEHAQFCRELAERSGGLENQGPFTPFGYRPLDSPPRSTIVFPGSAGGASWGGTAADPRLGYVFVNTTNEGWIGWMEAVPPGDAAGLAALPYRRTSAVGGPLARFRWDDAEPGSADNEIHGHERAWPCQKPPWGELAAVDVATGDVAWQVPLGITERLPARRQRTGRLNMGGPIATAGGVVFIGATDDRRFRAFASRTGEQLWATQLELSAHAVPVTYLGADGRQYVAIVAGGAAAIDDPNTPGAQALIAYALP